jgi:hypothetical protein
MTRQDALNHSAAAKAATDDANDANTEASHRKAAAMHRIASSAHEISGDDELMGKHAGLAAQHDAAAARCKAAADNRVEASAAALFCEMTVRERMAANGALQASVANGGFTLSNLQEQVRVAVRAIPALNTTEANNGGPCCSGCWVADVIAPPHEAGETWKAVVQGADGNLYCVEFTIEDGEVSIDGDPSRVEKTTGYEYVADAVRAAHAAGLCGLEGKAAKCEHLNADGTFKGGFDGCVLHMTSECGGSHSEESEQKHLAQNFSKKFNIPVKTNAADASGASGLDAGDSVQPQLRKALLADMATEVAGQATTQAQADLTAESHKLASDAHQTAFDLHKDAYGDAVASGADDDDLAAHTDAMERHSAAKAEHEDALKGCEAASATDVQALSAFNASVKDAIEAGDYPGHPFRGNQYASGSGAGAANRASAKAHEATKNAKTPEEHRAAAVEHQKAAMAQRKKGNQETADYHDMMAQYHGTEAKGQEQHAEADAASAKALKKSAKAVKSDSKENHLAAEKAHNKAADAQKEAGDENRSKQHRRLAGIHHGMGMGYAGGGGLRGTSGFGNRKKKGHKAAEAAGQEGISASNPQGINQYTVGGGQSIGRNKYSEAHKDRLRSLAHESTAHSDAAHAHWRAAGHHGITSAALKEKLSAANAANDRLNPAKFLCVQAQCTDPSAATIAAEQATRLALEASAAAEEVGTPLEHNRAAGMHSEAHGAHAAALAAQMQAAIDAGDFPGHPFRGNQYAGGSGGRSERERASAKAHEASKAAFTSGSKADHEHAAAMHKHAAAAANKSGRRDLALYHDTAAQMHDDEAKKSKAHNASCVSGEDGLQSSVFIFTHHLDAMREHGEAQRDHADAAADLSLPPTPTEPPHNAAIRAAHESLKASGKNPTRADVVAEVKAKDNLDVTDDDCDAALNAAADGPLYADDEDEDEPDPTAYEEGYDADEDSDNPYDDDSDDGRLWQAGYDAGHQDEYDASEARRSGGAEGLAASNPEGHNQYTEKYGVATKASKDAWKASDVARNKPGNKDVRFAAIAAHVKAGQANLDAARAVRKSNMFPEEENHRYIAQEHFNAARNHTLSYSHIKSASEEAADANSASNASGTSGLQAGASALGALECSGSASTMKGFTAEDGAIMVMPSGIHDITPSLQGKAVRVIVSIEPGAAVALENQRKALLAAHSGHKPFFSVEHKSGCAAFWPKKFSWDTRVDATGQARTGVWADGTWSAAGVEARDGKNYRGFSPTFFVNEVKADPDDPAVVVCSPDAKLNMGALENDPAFADLPPLWAHNAASPQFAALKAAVKEKLGALKASGVNPTLADLAAAVSREGVEATEDSVARCLA